MLGLCISSVATRRSSRIAARGLGTGPINGVWSGCKTSLATEWASYREEENLMFHRLIHKAEKGDTTSEKRISRQHKPLKINLGDVQESTLDAIVDSGSPVTMVQDMNSDLVTPDLARQAIQAKQHEHQADSLAQNRKFNEAAEEYKHAIRIAPYEDEILYMSLGGVLSELREHTEALQYLEIASAINALNEDVARNLGICRMNAGKSK